MIPVLPVVLAIALLVVIVAGITLNYDAIARAYFKGRSGMSRVITQVMSLSFGLLVALLFFNLARMNQLSAISRGARPSASTTPGSACSARSPSCSPRSSTCSRVP